MRMEGKGSDIDAPPPRPRWRLRKRPTVSAAAPDTKQEQLPHARVKVVLLGDPGVGKTCLAALACGDRAGKRSPDGGPGSVGERSPLHREAMKGHRETSVADTYEAELDLLDPETGQPTRTATLEVVCLGGDTSEWIQGLWCGDAAAFVLCFASTRPCSLESLRRRWIAVGQPGWGPVSPGLRPRPCVVAACKADLWGSCWSRFRADCTAGEIRAMEAEERGGPQRLDGGDESRARETPPDRCDDNATAGVLLERRLPYSSPFVAGAGAATRYGWRWNVMCALRRRKLQPHLFRNVLSFVNPPRPSLAECRAWIDVGGGGGGGGGGEDGAFFREASKRCVGYIECSAETGKGVDLVFEAAVLSVLGDGPS